MALHLARLRATERRRLVRGLRSARFERWRTRWRTSLAELAAREGSRPRYRPCRRSAAERIAHAYRRVLRRGRRITPASPADDLHDLRKRCKELRYLLEIFAPLLDPSGVRNAVKELKTVQDVLGAFQDSEAQRETIYALAAEMVARGDAAAPTMLAMGEVAARMQESMLSSRAEFIATFERYARLSVPGRMARLSPPDPTPADTVLPGERRDESGGHVQHQGRRREDVGRGEPRLPGRPRRPPYAALGSRPAGLGDLPAPGQAQGQGRRQGARRRPAVAGPGDQGDRLRPARPDAGRLQLPQPRPGPGLHQAPHGPAPPPGRAAPPTSTTWSSSTAHPACRWCRRTWSGPATCCWSR